MNFQKLKLPGDIHLVSNKNFASCTHFLTFQLPFLFTSVLIHISSLLLKRTKIERKTKINKVPPSFFLFQNLTIRPCQDSFLRHQARKRKKTVKATQSNR